MESSAQQRLSKKLSLRTKLLIGFTLLFSGVFGLIFYWFYTFTINKTSERLYADMHQTIIGAAKEIDPLEVVELYEDGFAFKDSLADGEIPTDPIFQKHLALFQKVNDIEPRAWLYTYVVVDEKPAEFAANVNPGSPGNRPPTIRPDELAKLTENDVVSTVFLVDLWVRHDPSKAAQFLRAIPSNEFHLQAFERQDLVDRPLYDDGLFGSWITTYLPLRNAEGETIAVLGIDFQASYVQQVKNAIRNRMLVGFFVIYLSLFILVYILSSFLTRPIIKLTSAAEKIGEGDYTYDFKTFRHRRLPDEVSTLAEVFVLMVSKVRRREESLKMQVQDLKVEIDEVKRKKQVQKIIDSDFFLDLQSKSKKIRSAMERANQKNKGQ
ncbi:HAMP domain-containing protein [Oscillatoria sp. CS-180]|uniref:HAMP domain-containing protein n=1 Tax=Oscillatoria sp. CS-180 TaxID=3021720 RepID=UPI002330A5DC|nr:HAMP domain-containing protein [Oscillatoria sp. CS-180]MDB9529659.1 HAMP domain-containing protein [Oscillatoria sp. CS-180]